MLDGKVPDFHFSVELNADKQPDPVDVLSQLLVKAALSTLCWAYAEIVVSD